METEHESFRMWRDSHLNEGAVVAIKRFVHRFAHVFVVLSCSALWRSCHTIREHATDEGLMRGQGELIVGQYPDDDLARQSGELAPSCIQSILMKASTLCSGVPIYPCAQGDAWSVKYEARRGAGSYMGGTTREVIAQVVGSSHVGQLGSNV